MSEDGPAQQGPVSLHRLRRSDSIRPLDNGDMKRRDDRDIEVRMARWQASLRGGCPRLVVRSHTRRVRKSRHPVLFRRTSIALSSVAMMRCHPSVVPSHTS
jgi:hypothetical protein